MCFEPNNKITSCNHCLCNDCYSHKTSDLCPVCRKNISQEFERVYEKWIKEDLEKATVRDICGSKFIEIQNTCVSIRLWAVPKNITPELYPQLIDEAINEANIKMFNKIYMYIRTKFGLVGPVLVNFVFEIVDELEIAKVKLLY